MEIRIGYIHNVSREDETLLISFLHYVAYYVSVLSTGKRDELPLVLTSHFTYRYFIGACPDAVNRDKHPFDIWVLSDSQNVTEYMKKMGKALLVIGDEPVQSDPYVLWHKYNTIKCSLYVTSELLDVMKTHPIMTASLDDIFSIYPPAGCMLSTFEYGQRMNTRLTSDFYHQLATEDDFHLDRGLRVSTPSESILRAIKKGSNKILHQLKSYDSKNTIIIFVGNSPSYFYYTNIAGFDEYHAKLLPISGRYMHNSFDTPPDEAIRGLCRQVKRATKGMKTIILIDITNGDSVEGLLRLLGICDGLSGRKIQLFRLCPAACKMPRFPEIRIPVTRITIPASAFEQIYHQQITRLMPDSPPPLWNLPWKKVTEAYQRHPLVKACKQKLKEI